jgi:ribosome biogenesis SPOUT family RNA methylase Rps3
MASFNATLDTTKKHTFIVEHMDPELEKWQILEYSTIASECTAASSQFILSGLPKHVSDLSQVEQSPSSVDDLVSGAGIPKERVCLLDPRGESDLAPEDGDKFDVFVFGGILGDDPPRDRTAELRVKGFGGRRLGKEQLTTDTAARVTRIVVQEKSEFVMFFFLVLFFFLFCLPNGRRRNLLTCVKSPSRRSPLRRPSQHSSVCGRERRDAFQVCQGQGRQSYHARGTCTPICCLARPE